MKYSTTIDNIHSIEWNLSIQEAYLFAWFFSVPSWASCVKIDGKDFYFASRSKAISDNPMLTEKPDTMYRYYKSLEDKGIIITKKIDGQDYISITEKGQLWNRQSEYSENNPSKFGKKSENKEKHYIVDKNIVDKEHVLIYPYESEEFKNKWEVWKTYRKQQHNFKYKSKISEQGALKKLAEMSKSEKEAMAIIDQSISAANGWKDFYPLKTKEDPLQKFKQNGQSQQQHTINEQTSTEFLSAEFDRRFNKS